MPRRVKHIPCDVSSEICVDAPKQTPIRGILKKRQMSDKSDETSGNNNGSDQINRPRDVFSPNSTPSAGFLKRRRHLFGETTDGEESTNVSPVAKRRVHFSTTDVILVSNLSDDDEALAQESPRKRPRISDTNGSNGNSSQGQCTSPSSSFSSRFQTRTIRMVQQAIASPTNDANIDVAPSTDVAPSSDVALSRDDSPPLAKELDTVMPVYPSLINCPALVDSLVPHLSPPSSWYRSLTGVLKSRGVTTIGHLAALTEYQISQLPFRLPKMETVHKRLQIFEQTHPSSTEPGGKDNSDGGPLFNGATAASTTSES